MSLLGMSSASWVLDAAEYPRSHSFYPDKGLANLKLLLNGRDVNGRARRDEFASLGLEPESQSPSESDSPEVGRLQSLRSNLT